MDPILSSFDRQFSLIDSRSRELLSMLEDGRLFENTVEGMNSIGRPSCGENILRSAATVEKTFGGITTRLWDDPFEWTLPEKLSDKSAVITYLDEVETTRQKGFAFFTSDNDLHRQIPAPERLTPILDILLETLVRASHYQGRAFAVYQVITGERPPRV